MLTAQIIVAVAMVLEQTPTDTLKELYWDCDTLYMQQQMSGEDLARCLSITYSLQDRFPTPAEFYLWWEKNRRHEWQKRGYREHAT